MVATVDDMRQALFHLATSEWMLTDSDRTRFVPLARDILKPASVQQLLAAPRPAMVFEPESTPTQASNQEGDYPGPRYLTGGPGGPTLDPGTLIPSGEAAGGDPSKETTYEVTRIRMPLSSLTDDSKREGVWGLIRELASLVDPG